MAGAESLSFSKGPPRHFRVEGVSASSLLDDETVRFILTKLSASAALPVLASHAILPHDAPRVLFSCRATRACTRCVSSTFPHPCPRCFVTTVTSCSNPPHQQEPASFRSPPYTPCFTMGKNEYMMDNGKQQRLLYVPLQRHVRTHTHTSTLHSQTPLGSRKAREEATAGEAERRGATEAEVLRGAGDGPGEHQEEGAGDGAAGQDGHALYQAAVCQRHTKKKSACEGEIGEGRWDGGPTSPQLSVAAVFLHPHATTGSRRRK